jgi:hypothetical protein
MEEVEATLKQDLGEDTYNKSYSILIDFGDNILFDENRVILEARLAHLMPKEKVR